MNFFVNIKRSGIIAVTALIALFAITGCQPEGDPFSSGGYSSFDSNTAEPSGSDSVYSDNSGGGGEGSAPFSGTSNGSDISHGVESSADTSSEENSPGGSSGSSGESDVSAVVGPGHDSNSSSVPSSVPASSSVPPASSSTVINPKPPAEVVIPDFEMPASPGVNIFTASNGWVDYSNASKGYISAMYTGTKLRAKLRVSANGEEYTFDLSIGGVVEYFPLSMGNGTYTVALFEQVEGTSYATVLRNQFEVNMPNPRSPFMYSNRYVKYDKSSKCVYKAAELCVGKTDNISKIAAIFQWVTDNITYDNQLAATVKSNTVYYPDPDRTYQKRTGICYDYASLMAAMLRSQGIPTRLVKGDAGDLRHAWNEIYTEQTGWITPELLLRNNGYNTVDATFYAGASDKSKIAQYISNPSNYLAIEYY